MRVDAAALRAAAQIAQNRATWPAWVIARVVAEEYAEAMDALAEIEAALLVERVRRLVRLRDLAGAALDKVRGSALEKYAPREPAPGGEEERTP